MIRDATGHAGRRISEHGRRLGAQRRIATVRGTAMPDTTTVIRWRNRRNRYSRWHLPVSIPADDSGQTACGLRYERKRSETGALADGEMCRNCLRVQLGTVPGEP